MRIMDSRERVLRGKTVRLVKVLWQRRGGDMGARGHRALQLSFLVRWGRCAF